MPHDDKSLALASHEKLTHYGSFLQTPVLLLVRLAWGWELYLSGYRHLHNVPTMIENFKKWGVPLPGINVYISGTTELVGGLLLMAGLATRIISVPLLINFIVAYVTASRSKLADTFTGDHLGGLESLINDDAFPFFVLTLLLIAFGPGKASIDYLLKRSAFRGRDERSNRRGFETVMPHRR